MINLTKVIVGKYTNKKCKQCKHLAENNPICNNYIIFNTNTCVFFEKKEEVKGNEKDIKDNI